ncbi:MAG: hypothetical protein AB8G23_04470 [Myxococcota bacterium]
MASDLRSDLRSNLPSEVESEPTTHASSHASSGPADSKTESAGTSVSESDDTASSSTSALTSGTGESAKPVDAAASPERSDRADLNLVRSPDAPAGEGAKTGADAGEDAPGRGIPIWLGLLGLVIAALIVGYQMRLNGQLQAVVTGLEAELGRTQAVLTAHQSHLGNIRGGVRELSAQLQSLQDLVETEPVVARDEGATRE